MTRINFGCGTRYMDGYVNTDFVRTVRADKYFDMNTVPYPLRTNYADYMLLDNMLEHLRDIPAVMQELHRIGKPGSIVEIIVPYGKSDGALQDPTHTHFFTEHSMDYFRIDNPEAFYTGPKFILLENKLGNANKTVLSKLRYLIPFKMQLRYLLWNMYDHIRFRLVVAK